MNTLTQQQINKIEDSFVGIPQDYLDWLSGEGWGEHESGYMFYSGPVYPKDIFGADFPKGVKDLVLVADDMAGFFMGFNSSWKLVGIDSCGWKIQVINEGLSTYIKC